MESKKIIAKSILWALGLSTITFIVTGLIMLMIHDPIQFIIVIGMLSFALLLVWAINVVVDNE